MVFLSSSFMTENIPNLSIVLSSTSKQRHPISYTFWSFLLRIWHTRWFFKSQTIKSWTKIIKNSFNVFFRIFSRQFDIFEWHLYQLKLQLGAFILETINYKNCGYCIYTYCDKYKRLLFSNMYVFVKSLYTFFCKINWWECPSVCIFFIFIFERAFHLAYLHLYRNTFNRNGIEKWSF